MHLQVPKYLGQDSFCQYDVYQSGEHITGEIKDDPEAGKEIVLKVNSSFKVALNAFLKRFEEIWRDQIWRDLKMIHSIYFQLKFETTPRMMR